VNSSVKVSERGSTAYVPDIDPQKHLGSRLRSPPVSD
jgi:hypothetical protein